MPICNGETIANYPDERPYPSRLILHYLEGYPIHVVVARDPACHTCFVVAAYRPEPKLWSADFKTRRSP